MLGGLHCKYEHPNIAKVALTTAFQGSHFSLLFVTSHLCVVYYYKVTLYV